MTHKTIETILGILVLLLAGQFVVNAYTKSESTKLFGKSTYKVYAAFDRIDGINVGSPVTLSGIKIGEVVDQRLDEESYNAVLGINIDQDHKLPNDTLAEIVSSSLLGDKYISLVPGAETTHLKDGDRIEFTQSSISFENLISKMVFGLDVNKKEGPGKFDNDDSGDDDKIA